ncbi:MAG: hypothetical protein JWQ07_2722 [Ramlibacter sp.]|nr:hypothetical protein [Ramlibacter sp.]
MAWPALWTGPRLAGAGLLLAALGVAWMLWPGANEVPQAAGVPASPMAPATVPLAGPAQIEAAAPLAGAPAAAEADPHTQFMLVVKAARERPQPPPPPAIAKAKSFPEAFEAMRAAQQAEANGAPGTATLNPFAPVVK